MNAVAPAPSALERVKAWYAGLEAREQRTVAVGGIVGAALALLVIVLQLHGAVAKAERRVAQKRADVAYIQGMLPELRAAPVPQGGDLSLVVVVDRTSRDAGLASNVRGTEPAGGNALRVRLEGASFDSTVNWIVRLQREYGVRIQAASLERTGAPGLVNASVTLVRS
jgi:type II secretory pathway component PulM